MEFKFDANQEFQLNAIEAVMDLFEGQPCVPAGVKFTDGTGFASVPNQLEITEKQLLLNLQAIQQANGLKTDSELKFIEGTATTPSGSKQVHFANFSVEMETGTGKTYVYIRTMLELCQRYGLRKFIVVVPSVAVKEGVLKALAVTRKHLKERYGSIHYRYYAYDSKNLSQVRQFTFSDCVEIMVMTIDSFKKADLNVIHKSTDRLQGEVPIHLIQATRPILILDEPQNMESSLSISAFAMLDPLLALRYSATHRDPYNQVYRLTPYDAYRQGLVKRIEIASVVKEGEVGPVFVRLESIDAKKTMLTARITIHQLMKTGIIKEKTITVKPVDALQEKSGGRAEYAGFEIGEISKSTNTVRFANGVEIKVGDSIGADKDAIFEAQIHYTIEEHFRKQAKLKVAKIKVLSLFFIDRVDNYRPENSKIRMMFNKSFNELKTKYPEWKDVKAERVQVSYFASKKHKGGAVEFVDSESGKTKEDEEAYNLIMKDKERLLSFEHPAAFVFSHSALREGWDNPNIFQICTLNQTASEIKKRQEVGRGVRLAVDQTGIRVKEEQVNILTVVANDSYERYVGQLQSEIEDAYGKEGLPPKPANARKRMTIKLRKEYTLKPEFKKLWDLIKHKTRYAVKIDSSKLVSDTVTEFDKHSISTPRVAITKVQVDLGADDVLKPLQMSGAKTVIDLSGRYPLPNLVELVANQMEYTTPPLRLSRNTILRIFQQAKNKKAAMDNPQEFASIMAQVIKEQLADQLIDGIKYEKINEWYEMTQFIDEIPDWEDYLEPSKRISGKDGAGLYDYTQCDSGPEHEFAKALEQRDDVKLYIKLPRWFTVQTPIGEYNPDWAIVMEQRDEHGHATSKPLLYLVRETKSTKKLDELRPDERRKIQCGESHFKQALGVNYSVVTTASELP
ncbi:MAG: DEAD/DEAH box helicase family protein [Candidatus Micrarchaeia archaeon]